ncbi:MAG: hypothetical protein IJN40_02785, partial [Clostridia bacterium]|nr:hypothetical protein [Clostridia bacterium]
WIYLDRYEDILNWKYINKELEDNGLLVFEQLCKKLSGIWFKDDKHTEITAELEYYIITGSLFGLKSRYVLSDYVINQGAKKMTPWKKVKRLLSAIFLSYSMMCGKYPILVKCPILLPFCWAHRAFKALFFKQDRVKEIANYYDDIKISEAEKMESFKKSIGL